jgi:predicted NodU family carbamoyl transferase
LSRDGHEVVLFDNVSRAGVQLNLDWLKGQLTLGINYSQMHDSSGRVVRDGELLFAVAEERISRAKHDAQFPRNAIQACLKFVKVRAEQLDEVCLGWQTAGPVFWHDLKMLRDGKMSLTYLKGMNSTLHFLSTRHQEIGAKKFTQQFDTNESADSVCGSSPGTRHQRLRLLRF